MNPADDLRARLAADIAQAERDAAQRPLPPEWEFEDLQIIEPAPVPPAAVLEALGLGAADEAEGT